MQHLTPEDLGKLKQHLQAYQHELQNRISRMQGELSQSMTQSVGELSAYDQHSSDLGFEMYERSRDIGLMDNLRMLAGRVQDALEAIDDGSYGVCDVCGQPIDADRLWAIPYTTLCYACSEELPSRESRPVEEKVLGPPFGRSFRDEDDYTGFDGEDAWQELARWGNANSPQDVGGGVSVDQAYIDAAEVRSAVEEMDQFRRRGSTQIS